MVGDRVVVAVVPVPDRGENPIRIEIERIGAAAHLGRQHRDPVAQALPPHIRPGVDELPGDVVALCFGVVGAGMAKALIGDRSGSQYLGADDRRLGDTGRADGDVQHHATAQPAFSLLLDLGCGHQLALLACAVFFLETPILLEFSVILLGDFGASFDEGVDRRVFGRQIGLRFVWRKVEFDLLAGCCGRRLGRFRHCSLPLLSAP